MSFSSERSCFVSVAISDPLRRGPCSDAPLDLEDRDRGHEPDKQQEQEEEQAEAADERGRVQQRRLEVVPGGRQKAPRQRRHDDDEALEPHADVNQDAKREDRPQVGS